MLRYIVVSRHPSFVKLVFELGLVPKDTPVAEMVGPADVAGKIVVGAIPIDIASRALAVIVPKLRIPKEDRDKELTYEELKKCLLGFRTFMVREVKDE